MRILLLSYSFWPNLGGIETVSRLLAGEWHRLGHEVIVTTMTPSAEQHSFPFRLVRAPGHLQLVRLFAWADVSLQNNISLRLGWPRLFFRKPAFITHQTWLWHGRPKGHLIVRLKRAYSRLSGNIAISRAVAADLGLPEVALIGNPYDDSVFQTGEPFLGRRRDFLFVGRLVPDKGLDIFIQSLGNLRMRGLEFTATVVGNGIMLEDARHLAAKLSVDRSVEFRGALSGRALADCYREHRVLIVPSRWAEPFGIVALEGSACGCLVVGSNGGGLPEAIGPGGLTFPNGNVGELTRIMVRLLEDQDRRHESRAASDRHLASLTPRSVAARYIEVFQQPI